MDGTEADMGDLLMRDDLGERQEELVEDTQVGRDRDMIYLLDQNYLFLIYPFKEHYIYILYIYLSYFIFLYIGNTRLNAKTHSCLT